MTTVSSLAQVKSPFKAVAEYPPTLPYIGQDVPYNRLHDFTQSIRAEEQAHFLALFGNWAIGKSRLAHELIAQFCGSSPGWILTTGERAAPLLQPLQRGGDILPLFVSFVDVINFQRFGLETDTVMGKVTCAAAAYLADKALARGSHRDLLKALHDALESVYPNFDFDRLKNIAEDTSRTLAERAELIVKAISAMTQGQVRRVLVIVDEVESGGEVNPFADVMEKELGNRPIPSRAPRDLYSGVKDATNTNAYPSLNFLFFNTDAVKLQSHMEALERRMFTADLERATAVDLERLLDTVRQAGYPLTGKLDDLAQRAFFAADRNFGWFSFIMNKAHYALVENDTLSIDEVFSVVFNRTGKVFQPGVFEDRDIAPPELKAAMRRVIYNQMPTSLADLGIDPALRPDMLAYKDPFQTRFIGEATIVVVSADMLTRGLLATNLYKSEGEPKLTGEGSVLFDPAAVLGSLRTFAWTSDADTADTNLHLWVYTDAADFENQLEFAYGGFGGNLSASTARTIHKLLMEQCRVPNDAYRVAPTMALLRRFNDLWGKASANYWLPEDKWARVISTIDSSPQLNDQRLLQGVANVLFDEPQKANPSPYPDVKAPSLILKLESHEKLNVTSRNQFVLLKARETPEGIAEDLRTIRQRVPVLLIFEHVNRLDGWKKHIREAHEDHLAVGVIPHVVEPQTREWEFYVRYALRDTPEGFKQSEMESRGKDLRMEFREVLNERFKQWLTSAEEQGYVLRPFYPARNASSSTFREFARSWAMLLRAGGMAALGSQAPSVQKGLEDYERERQSDTLQLTTDDGHSLQAAIPAVTPHVLDMLREQPRRLAELADELFYVRSSRTAVIFPSSNAVALEQLLTLLQEAGVVDADEQSRYSMRTIPTLTTKFDQAFQRLGADEGTLSGYVSMVASLSDPIKTLAHQLGVNEAQLNLLKNQRLRPQQDQLRQLPLARLVALPPDEPAYREVARDIGAVSAAIEVVFGQAGAAVTPPPIDPNTLRRNIDDIVADTTYSQFSIEYRVAFLRQLQEYLTNTEQGLGTRLKEARGRVASTDGVAFPDRPLLGLLDSVQADLDGNLPGNILPAPLRQQQQDATLKVLKDAGRLSDVLIKLDWYTKQLDEQNPDGWQTRYSAARAQWKTAREEFAQVETSWEQLTRYFAGTAHDHIIKFTGAELANNMRDLSEAVMSFVERQNAANVSLEELTDEITAIHARCASEAQRIQAAHKDAESEITDALETSNDAAVRHLAERLKNEKNLPDRQRVQDARTHQEAHGALERYQEAVANFGRSLCERDGLYDRYLQVYRDNKQGMTGDQIYKNYDEKTLRELSDRHLITIRNVVEL